MVNWIKWRLIWCVICVVATYTAIKHWLYTKGLYNLIYCCKIFVMVEFVLSVLKLDYIYSDQRTFLYAYIVLMAASYFMLSKLLKSLKENEDGNDTS